MSELVEILVQGVGEAEFRLSLREGETVLIGRDPACQIVVRSEAVAPRHARLTWDGERIRLDPLVESDVLHCDCVPITDSVEVVWGQKIALGPATLTLRVFDFEEWPTAPASAAAIHTPRTAAANLARDIETGRYEDADRELGAGGMGLVREVLEKPLGRAVAMKRMRAPDSGREQERFIREARITGQLEHPSIVPVHELSVDAQGRIFYTMKLLRGVTLAKILKALAAGNPEALARYDLAGLLIIYQKVCDAIAFAHSRNPPVIHRDLKPQNIIVGDYGEVQVVDWGLAKVLEPQDPAVSEKGEVAPEGSELAVPAQSTSTAGSTRYKEGEIASEVGLTLDGEIVGTPAFMPPEQARGDIKRQNERTDIYALGAILYAILFLKPPLEGPARETARRGSARRFGERAKPRWRRTTTVFSERIERGEVASAIREGRRLPRLQFRPRSVVPESLAAVIRKAMAVEPSHRYESVLALQADIAAFQEGFATTAEDAGAWRQFLLLVRRHRAVSAASTIALLLIVLLSVVFGIAVIQQRDRARESNVELQKTLSKASVADHATARERFRAGAWREGVALLGRSLAFWPENVEAANYLLNALAFGRGDRDRLPLYGVRHDGPIADAVFSPTGRCFATASYDHTTRLWDTTTGQQIGRTMRHAGPCGAPSFSPDGAQLVTTGADGVAQLWDAQTGEALAPPMHHGRPDLDSLSDVLTAVFSPDGKQIITASLDHTARVWDAGSGKEIAQLINPHRVSNAIFSPDGSRILTAYWYGGAILWDAMTFRPIGFPMKHDATVRRAVFTPDGTRIVTTSLDKTARIWDGWTAEPLTPPLSHPDVVWDVDVSADGNMFATACYDKRARLWSVRDGTPIGLPMEHAGPINSVAFSADGQQLVTANRDHTVRLWNTATCQPVAPPMRHDETVMRALFHPDSTKLLSVGWDGGAYVWDSAAPAWPGEILPFPGPVQTIEFGQDDDRVFVATRAGRAGVWSLREAKFVASVSEHGAEITGAAFHPTSSQFATAGADGIIRFWNAAGKQVGETSPSAPDSIVALAYGTNGRSVFAAHESGSVRQWSISGTPIGEVMKHSEKMDALAVAPSGSEIATGARDDYLHFWHTADGTPLRGRLRHGNPVLAISYHPTRKLIATGCDDHTARIWSLDSGQQEGEPIVLAGRATVVRYTAAGNALLVGGRDQTEVHCYDTSTRNPLYSLPHPSGVIQIAANATASLIVTVTTDGVARLWRIRASSGAAAKWLPEYLDALGGLSFSPGQQLLEVPTSDRLKTRHKLVQQAHDGSAWHDVMLESFQRTKARADQGTSRK